MGEQILLWQWVAMMVIAVVALIGSAVSSCAIEREREEDEHEGGLPL